LIPEIISSKSSYNSISSMSVYYFEDINRLANVRLPKEIIKVIDKDY